MTSTRKEERPAAARDDSVLERLLHRPRRRPRLDDLPLRLQGERVLVIGAATPVGSALVRCLARMKEVTVVALDRDGERLEQLAATAPRRIVPAFGDAADHGLWRDLARGPRLRLVLHASPSRSEKLAEVSPRALLIDELAGMVALLRALRTLSPDAFVHASDEWALRPDGVLPHVRRVVERLVIGTALRGAASRCVVLRRQRLLDGPNGVARLGDAPGEQEPPRSYLDSDEAAEAMLASATRAESGELTAIDAGPPVAWETLRTRWSSTASAPADAGAAVVEHPPVWLPDEIFVARDTDGFERRAAADRSGLALEEGNALLRRAREGDDARVRVLLSELAEIREA